MGKDMLKKLPVVTLLLGASLLGGCQSISDTYHRVVDDVTDYVLGERETTTDEDQGSEGEAVTEEEGTTEGVDVFNVPASEDLTQALSASEDFNLGLSLYSDTSAYTLNRNGFEMTVEALEVFKVSKPSDDLTMEFNFDSKGGGLVVLKVTAHNHRDEDIFFPTTDLKLSYEEADAALSPSTLLYPSLGGNLVDVLNENGGAISPDQTVEGYLIYGLGKSDLEAIESQESFYLTMKPRSDATDLAGLTNRTFGTDLKMYLPLSDSSQKLFQEQQGQIPDILSTDNWGEKTILAEETLDKNKRDQGVDFYLRRIEVSNFEPNEYHEESFETFVNGVVIVSIEYDVTNETEEKLLPVDGPGKLTINGDDIFNEYVLTTDSYGQEVDPGKKVTVVKTFALDKQYYVNNWQGEVIDIELTAPTTTEEEMLVMISSQEDEEEAVELTDDSRIVNFKYTPKLLWEIDENLELVKVKKKSLRELQSHSEDDDLDVSEENEEVYPDH